MIIQSYYTAAALLIFGWSIFFMAIGCLFSSPPLKSLIIGWMLFPFIAYFWFSVGMTLGDHQSIVGRGQSTKWTWTPIVYRNTNENSNKHSNCNKNWN